MSHPATDALYVLHRASKQAAAERKRADAELAKLEPRIRNMLAGHDLSTPEGIARCHNHLFDILRDKVGSEFEPHPVNYTDAALDDAHRVKHAGTFEQAGDVSASIVERLRPTRAEAAE